MIRLDPITPQLVADYKAVRLRALKDSPSAFGSTYEREVQLTDEEWNARAARLQGGRDAGFLAHCDGEYAGLAVCFFDKADPHKAELVSMWVASEQRRHGVGRLLVEAVAAWAHQHSATTLRLMVTGSNSSATNFYQRIGFSQTGRSEPYPNDPAILQYEMSKPLP
jgi:ribosomal protein S18 acetylase RimI-like enzyme